MEAPHSVLLPAMQQDTSGISAGQILQLRGATNPTYTTGVAGNYKVVVSGNCRSTITSNTVTLSVNAGVTIVTQPVSTQICAGGTESFSVVATGATGYQWYRNSNLIIGATNAQYFTGIAARYDVRVSDACGGSVMSNFAIPDY